MPAVTPGMFREMFPALARQAWLDTPASSPGAVPVTAALAAAIAGWQEGSVAAADWEAAAPRARVTFARYLGVPESQVALMGSVAEAAATVAASLPPGGGTVVVGDGEFRSNLFPWLALEARGYRAPGYRLAARAVPSRCWLCVLRRAAAAGGPGIPL